MFWRFFGDVSESWLEVVFFENFLGGAAEDCLKCKKRSGIHSDRALLLNALPVPLLRQVFQNSCFTCMGAHFRSNMAPDPEMLPETSPGRLQDEF